MSDKKIVIITGGSSGIGKALCIKFGQEGYTVIFCGRNKEQLQQTSLELSDAGIENEWEKVDVSKEEECKDFIEKIAKKHGKIDVLINNAGISMRALFSSCELTVLKKVMDINFWGTVYCTKYALPYILASRGSIIGISSIAGFIGLPGRTGYSASKFAMHGFLQSLRIENRKHNLHVMIACPGFTASNIRNTALNAEGKPQGESPLDESKIMQPATVADIIFQGLKKKKNTLIMTTEGKLAVLLSRFFPLWIEKMVYEKMVKEPNSPFK